MLLSDSRMFLQLMTASAPVLGQTETTLYSMLIGVWWEKVKQSFRRKLILMDFNSLTT